MFKLFRKNRNGRSELKFADLDGLPLKEGDLVLSFRYDLGRCKVVKTADGMAYESLENGKIMHWAKMIDATTKNQKVRKIES